MDTCRSVEIIDEELIEFVEEQENPSKERKTVYDVELFKSFIQTSNPGLLGSTSLYEVLNDFLSKFILGVSKKKAPTMNQESRDISTNRTMASQFLLKLCLKLQWLRQSKTNWL